MNDIQNKNTDKIRKKIIRSAIGLKGFIICLTSGITALSIQVPVAVCEYYFKKNFPVVSTMAGLLTALLIFSALIFFGILISGLLMHPRDVDIRPALEKNIPSLVTIMSWAVSVFSILILSSIIIILLDYYLISHSNLLGSIILLCGSMLLFSLSVAYALKTTYNNIENTGESLTSHISSVLSKHNSLKNSRGRFIDRIDLAFASILSLMLYIIFAGDKIFYLLKPFINDTNLKSARQLFTGKNVILHIMPLIILVFAMSFTVKSIRTVLDTMKIKNININK